MVFHIALQSDHPCVHIACSEPRQHHLAGRGQLQAPMVRCGCHVCCAVIHFSQGGQFHFPRGVHLPARTASRTVAERVSVSHHLGVCSTALHLQGCPPPSAVPGSLASCLSLGGPGSSLGSSSTQPEQQSDLEQPDPSSFTVCEDTDESRNR